MPANRICNRLFIGIELPPDCRAALRDLDPRLPGLRWMPGEHLHLTLSFLGDVESSMQEALDQNLKDVRVPPFFLPLRDVGSFSARGRPSVVWVGVGKGHPHLFALHQHIQDAVLRAHLEPDLTPFKPHVTVARARDVSRQMLAPFLRKYRDAEFGIFKVTEFTLFSSVLTPEGATYAAELRVAL